MTQTPSLSQYAVQFINYHDEYPQPLEYNFVVFSPEDARGIIEALSSHFSGDPCECYINGDKAVLEKDWGLL